MRSEKLIPTWIKALSSLIITSITLGLLSMIFFYREFETQAAAISRENVMIQRLDRIENKLDRLIEQSRD
jgi:hypothetical protein